MPVDKKNIHKGGLSFSKECERLGLEPTDELAKEFMMLSTHMWKLKHPGSKYSHLYERVPELREAIVIGRTFSHCGNCGKDASPHEKAHETVIGYGEHGPGCRTIYKYVTSDYSGEENKQACIRIRPDLEWIDMYPDIPPQRRG